MKILLNSLDILCNKRERHIFRHGALLISFYSQASALRHIFSFAADAGEGHCALLWSHTLAFRISSAASAGLSTRPAERTFPSTTKAGVDITP